MGALMANHQIEIDGITIEILRKPIKNMHLRIYPPDGQVRVSAPLRLNLQRIYQQLEAKREWIHRQRARLLTQAPTAVPTMQAGEHHYFLGQMYRLTVVESTKSPQLTLTDNVLLLSAKPQISTMAKLACLKQWYQVQMHALIPALIEKWQPVIGVTVNSWGTKTMKTRWGSCNTRTRHICLNLVLIKKPLICLEYVMVHEMVHLLEASHNARFYRFMDHFMPQWRCYQQLLKNNVHPI